MTTQEDEKKLYVISAEQESLKVGISANPEKRIKQLATGTARQLSLDHVVRCEDAKGLELEIHEKLSGYHQKGEWFDYSCKTYLEGMLAGLEMDQSPEITDSAIREFVNILREYNPYQMGWYSWRERILKELVERHATTVTLCTVCENVTEVTEWCGNGPYCPLCGSPADNSSVLHHSTTLHNSHTDYEDCEEEGRACE